jgi:hypothetical protein
VPIFELDLGVRAKGQFARVAASFSFGVHPVPAGCPAALVTARVTSMAAMITAAPPVEAIQRRCRVRWLHLATWNVRRTCGKAPTSAQLT